jgi:hypothetical protein
MSRQAILAPLAAAVLLFTAAPAEAWTTAYGRTSAHDRVLRHGCHTYRYHYVVDAPTHDWTLETFLVDRTGETVSSNALSSDSEPERGYRHFGLCRWNTVPGRFTIRAKLIWYRKPSEREQLLGEAPKGHRAWFKPSHFRMHRPS